MKTPVTPRVGRTRNSHRSGRSESDIPRVAPLWGSDGARERRRLYNQMALPLTSGSLLRLNWRTTTWCAQQSVGANRSREGPHRARHRCT